MKYVIGDIHGCCKTFEKILVRSGLRKCDTLFLLGDYIDRGPDSCGVLTLIMGLMESGYDVRPLKGNHEELMQYAYIEHSNKISSWWFEEFSSDVFKSFGINCFEEIPQKYWTFIENLPSVLETEDYIFVHGTLDDTLDDPVNETNPITMRWGNTWHEQGIMSKTLVSGHQVTPLSMIEYTLDKGHILLDNGCYSSDKPDYGNLVMLNLDTKSLLIQPCCDELDYYR